MSQKTLLQTIQIVTAELSKLATPTTVLSSADPNIQKMLALTNAVLDDLSNEYDWEFLQKRFTFNTVPNQQVYPFPSDYERAINGTFFDASNRWEIRIVSPAQWEILNIWNLTPSPFEKMRVFGGEMNFFPIPIAEFNFVFDYISNNNVINGNTGEDQSGFQNDSDIIMFDSRLVINALKLKYLESIGEDTTTAMANYWRTLELKKGQDKPAQKLSLRPQSPRLISTANVPDSNFTI
jgi:hypothetical protein